MQRRSILFLLATVPLARNLLFAAETPPVILTGKLVTLPDKTVAIHTGDKDIRLSSKDEYLSAILADERLLGKTIQATGSWEQKDRRLEVVELHTVHDGKMHRISYYCQVCNIWSSKPGLCVCCLQPVELREIPV